MSGSFASLNAPREAPESLSGTVNSTSQWQFATSLALSDLVSPGQSAPLLNRSRIPTVSPFRRS